MKNDPFLKKKGWETRGENYINSETCKRGTDYKKIESSIHYFIIIKLKYLSEIDLINYKKNSPISVLNFANIHRKGKSYIDALLGVKR